MPDSLPFPRGSEWRKWDLHVHSPTSLLNNQFPRNTDGTPDWEKYLSCLEALDLSVLGITDYFTIDGYKELLEFRRQGRLKNIATILPNIEFRLDNVLASRKDGAAPRRLNFHVVFSDEVSPQNIEDHFLHDLDFYFEGSLQNRDEKRRLKVSEIEALGKHLQHQHAAFRNRSALEIGAMNAVVRHSDISEILSRDSRFRDKHLIVLPDELSNLVDWDGQDHIIRKNLLQKSDFVFSANPNTRNWCLGESPYMEGTVAFIEEFKSLKPVLHGSDAHSLGELGRPCIHRGKSGHSCESTPSDCALRNCWIKADPTFEGLKQVLYEPSDRLYIQEVSPAPVKSSYGLAGVEIKECTVNPTLRLAASRLDLNPGLVAVTGGKGSGKTALLDLIANCYTDRLSIGDKNSFVCRIGGSAPDLAVSLTFVDGTGFTKALSDGHFVSTSEVVYIAQGELEKYIGDGSDLTNYIHKLVFESPQVKDTANAFEFAQLSERRVALAKRLGELRRIIFELEQTSRQALVDGANSQLLQVKGELKDVTSRIAGLEKRLSKEKIAENQRRQESIRAHKEERDIIRQIVAEISAAESFLDADLVSFNETIGRINAFLIARSMGESLPSLVYPSGARLSALKNSCEESLRGRIKSIEDEEKALKSFAIEIQEHAKQLGRKNELAARQLALNQELSDIETGRGRLKSIREDRLKLFQELIQTVLDQKGKYDEVIAAFAAEKDAVLADLDFYAALRLDSRPLISVAEEIIDNRQVQVALDGKEKSVFAVLIDRYQRLTNGEVGCIEEILAETERLAGELRDKLKKAKTIDARALDKCLYDCYVDVTPVVTYKNTALESLSLGQKATVLIKIYLAQGSNPIIIDSHDDHLDNEFIMDELVGALRQAKRYRQVILASNNGNVVINSDAEQVVIANRDVDAISYVSGSLEEPSIRDRALKVLEGGADAFRRRRQKFRIT